MAESIVIFAPISHVGCFNVSSNVIFSNSFNGKSLNGPPDAVMIIERISSVVELPIACNIALCSLSTGISFEFESFSIFIILCPAIISDSLFARARSVPFVIVVIEERNPAEPEIAFKIISQSTDRIFSCNSSSPKVRLELLGIFVIFCLRAELVITSSGILNSAAKLNNFE